MLICPMKILNICGNSSRLVFLKNLPTLVMYCSGFSSKCVGISCGVDVFIVRNFRILKIFLFLPTRFCVKKIGPGSVTNIAMDKISHSGISMTIPISESKMSIILLKKCLYIRFFCILTSVKGRTYIFFIQQRANIPLYIIHCITFSIKYQANEGCLAQNKLTEG